MKKKKPPYLTKSRYLAGRDCEKRLWLTHHDPEPYTDPDPGSIQEIGIEVGQLAQQLFPGGVLVDQKPWDHQEAVDRTKALMADRKVPAIFEAGFVFDGVRVRADVVERVDGQAWALHEVKSSKKVKNEHLDDLAIQTYVLTGAGLTLDQVGLIHVNGDYVRGPDGLDPEGLLSRVDLTDQVQDFLADLPDQVQALHGVLARSTAPKVEPGKHCSAFCDFWDRCTAAKPKDWVYYFPGLRADKYQALVDQGYQTIPEVPDHVGLSDLQARVRDAHLTDTEYCGPDLGQALIDFGPPAFYLDFETISPAIPVYPGTRPYQLIPFQWSLHHLDEAGDLQHWEFLGDGPTDPRRDLAQSLIAALADSDDPIVVYSGYEARVINQLATDLPDLARPLAAIVDRLQDLHKLVKANHYHPAYRGSFSLKAVGPALVPDLGYDELDQISEGMAASAAFYGLATGQVEPDQDRTKVRADLLAYCELDSLAMVKVHRAFLDRAK